MKRKLLAITASALLALPAIGADGVVDYFNADFTGGIPSGVVVTDGDGQTLHFLMVQAGFDQGDSWKYFTERSTGNGYVASPSMHETAGTPADDRLTLPEIYLRGARASMSWKCRSINEQSRTASIYSVIVNGRTVVDKAEAPVARTWATADVSLEEFVGERVEIVFVNNSTNGEILALDDIVVSGEAGAATVTLVPGEYAFGTEDFKIGATFTASSSQPVKSVGISCVIDGQTYEAAADGLSLTDGAQTTLTLDREFSLTLGESMSYTVTPSVNGVAYDPIQCVTTQLAFMPHKRVVVEEGTGMWCGWCPEGIAATDSLRIKYGEDIIPIAIHFNASADYLAMDEYASALNITGAPSGLFDRTKDGKPLTLVSAGANEHYVMDRGAFGTLAAECFAIFPEAEINAEVTNRGYRMVEITTTTRFAKDATSSYRIAMVVVENDVWGRGYYQTNYLSNYPQRGPLSGNFTELPDMITSGFSFQHVARLVADDAYRGMEGSVPAELAAGKEYKFTKRITLPAGVNVDKAHVVAMLLDVESGAVVNACQVSTADLSGITSVGSSDDDAEQVSVSDGSVTIVADGAVSASLIDMAGRTVASGADHDSVTLTAPRGFYILRTSRTVMRIML